MKPVDQSKQLLMLKVVWGALLFSQIIYFFIAVKTLGEPTFNVFILLDDQLVLILSILAVAVLFLSQPLAKIILKTQAKFFGLNRENFEAKFTQVFFVSFIVRLVLIESSVIFGFTLSFIKKENLLLPFLIAGVIAFIINFPSLKKIKEEVRKTIQIR